MAAWVSKNVPSPYSLAHQLKAAEQALDQARHLLRAKYYLSSISQSYQVALRSAAGLLYGLNLDPKTEREIRAAFTAAFVDSHRSDPRYQGVFRRLEAMREKSDFDLDYEAGPAEAEEALALATDFYAEALRLQKEALK